MVGGRIMVSMNSSISCRTMRMRSLLSLKAHATVKVVQVNIYSWDGTNALQGPETFDSQERHG